MMPGPFFRALSFVIFVHFFADPTGGKPPAPADSLKHEPPQHRDRSSRLERSKRRRQQLLRELDLLREHATQTVVLESLPVRRSLLDNMPLANPGSGFAYNMPVAYPGSGFTYKMPIAKPGSYIDHMLRKLRTPTVPYRKESIRPGFRHFKRK